MGYLTEYYGVRWMRIIIDGRRVPRCYDGYSENLACFTRDGLKKRVVLHELFHHLIEAERLDAHSKRGKGSQRFCESYLKQLQEIFENRIKGVETLKTFLVKKFNYWLTVSGMAL